MGKDKLSFSPEEINNRLKKIDCIKSVNNTFANALKDTTTVGGAVVMKDISPVEHNIDVKVSSKNLANPQIFLNNGGELQSDGSVYFENANSISNIVIWENINNDSVICISYQLKTKYFDDASYTGVRFIVEYSDGTKSNVGIKKSEDYIPITFISPVNKKAVRVIGDYGGRSNSTWIKDFQIEIGTAATAYTPYIADIDAVKVRAQGKNILNIELFEPPNASNKDVFVKEGDIYTLTHNGNYRNTSLAACYIPANTPITVSIEHVEVVIDTDILQRGTIYIHLLDIDNKVIGNGIQLKKDSPTATTIFNKDVHYIRLYLTSWTTKGNYVKFKNLQLEVGETATEYEPYKEPVEYTQAQDIKSIYPCTTLTTDTTGALIECEYNRDINKAFAELQQAIISLGGNV